VLVAEDEAEALHEDRGDLFFTTSVENIETPLHTGHFLHWRRRKVGAHYLPLLLILTGRARSTGHPPPPFSG
jgi:hypothetical protein